MGAVQEDDTFPSVLRPPRMAGLCLMQLCSNSDSVPASRIREGQATHHKHGIVSAAVSSPEPPVPKELESQPRQQNSPTSWVERWLPAAARPYALLARLDKPDAIWLYAWPCFWYVDD
ncbi:hypothetical protein C2845_PM09G11670 [Panicum miliaceum]|uniref:Uncharacterized protein n=1 Tax=Panicum miliaceum TaxID=4540 RepID=A0A3L6RZK2_PANMI|nr:hypothetical protein C2845_PM09G11670 [Panicum miliaceum]